MPIFDINNRMESLSNWPLDIFIALLVYVTLSVAGLLIQRINIRKKPHYSFFFMGLQVKMLGGLAFAVLYLLYYGGGDTTAYWQGGESMKELLFKNPAHYFQQLTGNLSWENYFNYYNSETGYPPSWLYKSYRHFFVCRFTSIICIFIPYSFFGVSVFYGFLSYLGVWKLYETFIRNFPDKEKLFRWSVLLLPSLVFWTSGIMKDTLIMMFIGLFIYTMDHYLSEKKMKIYSWGFIIRIVVYGWFIWQIKPYVLLAAIPGLLLWISHGVVTSIRNRFVRFIIIPVFILSLFAGAFQIYLNFYGGEFSAENLTSNALTTRGDFAQNATYGENRYTTRKIDNSLESWIQAIPESLTAGLFRPFLWESNNIVMLLSGLENMVILLLFLYSVFRKNIFKTLSYIRTHPLLMYSLIFTLVLGFIVGFSAIIFGALVRFRTPLMPFFVSLLLVTATRKSADKQKNVLPSDQPIHLR